MLNIIIYAVCSIPYNERFSQISFGILATTVRNNYLILSLQHAHELNTNLAEQVGENIGELYNKWCE